MRIRIEWNNVSLAVARILVCLKARSLRSAHLVVCIGNNVPGVLSSNHCRSRQFHGLHAVVLVRIVTMSGFGLLPNEARREQQVVKDSSQAPNVTAPNINICVNEEPKSVNGESPNRP